MRWKRPIKLFFKKILSKKRGGSKPVLIQLFFKKILRYKSLIKFWSIIRGATVQFSRHNGMVMAAGMSFFAMLSLIPLTLLGVSLLGYLLGSSESAHQFMSRLLAENFPSAAAGMLEHIDSIITSPERSLVNWISALGLIWSGLRFFNILQRVISDIWVGSRPRWFLRGRLVAFISFIAAGLLFWFFFLLSSLIAAASRLNISFGGMKLSDIRGIWIVMKFAPTLISSFILFSLVYLFIPHGKISVRAALIGAAFGSVVLELSRHLFSFIIVKLDVYGRLYGSLASFFIFMSWLYLSMTMTIIGAELGSQCQEKLFRTSISQDKAKSRIDSGRKDNADYLSQDI